MNNEPVAYIFRQDSKNGFYETTGQAPAEMRPLISKAALGSLKGNSFQYLNWKGYSAVIVSKKDFKAHQRPNITTCMAVFSDDQARTLMSYPERLFRLRDYLLSLDSTCDFLNEWPKTVLLGKHFEESNWSPEMNNALHTIIHDMTGSRSCYLCDESHFSDCELLTLLAKLPIRLRTKVSFAYGYDLGCCSEILQLVIRKGGDPMFTPVPICTCFTAEKYPHEMAGEVLVKRSPETFAKLDNLNCNNTTYFKLLKVFGLYEQAKNRAFLTRRYPEEIRLLKTTQVISDENDLHSDAKLTQNRNAKKSRKKISYNTIIKKACVLAAVILLLLGIFWGTKVYQFRPAIFYITVRVSGEPVLKMCAVFLAGFLLGSFGKKRK